MHNRMRDHRLVVNGSVCDWCCGVAQGSDACEAFFGMLGSWQNNRRVFTVGDAFARVGDMMALLRMGGRDGGLVFPTSVKRAKYQEGVYVCVRACVMRGVTVPMCAHLCATVWPPLEL